MRNFSFLFISLIFISKNILAQPKLSLDLNVGIIHSIGKDIYKTYSSNTQPLYIDYFSRKKFEHPYFSVLAHLSYPVARNIRLGIQNGLYIHFLEHYFSNIERTSLSIPLMTTISYNIKNIKANCLGINLTGGINFFNIDDSKFKFRNGLLFNTSVYYILKKRSIIKLGIETEADNISFDFIAQNQFTHNETFKYHLNRISTFISYGYRIK